MKLLLPETYPVGMQTHHSYPPMDQWAPEEHGGLTWPSSITSSALLEENGESFDNLALAPARTWVRYGSPDAARHPGRPASRERAGPGRRLVGDRRRFVRARG